MTYQGHCHCGRVAYDVRGEIAGAISCNCSICHAKGSVLWFVPRADFTLRTPDEAASTYTFNSRVIKHRFCPVCGVSPYAEGVDPKGNAMAAINLRCVDGVDLAALQITPFDGRAR